MLNLIGDWNPQLLRELKGQLKPLKIIVAIALAIIGQIIFLVIAMGQLPGSLSPADVNITTYPEIYVESTPLSSSILLDDPSNPTSVQHSQGPHVLKVQSLYYNVPLENTPGQSLPKDLPDVGIGDRIVAIDGVPLVADGSQPSQTALTDAIVKPFIDDWNNISPPSTQISTKAIASTRRLRQAVPGSFLTLTVEKNGSASAEPIEITLPRILTSTRMNSYCLLPGDWDESGKSNHRSSYAKPNYNETFYQDSCQVLPGQMQYQINWSKWHQDGFWVLNLATVFALLMLGGYSIINNLLKEERDGTLNFIRLSPRSAWDILIGKILGVPTLIYGALALTLPLNLFHGVTGGIPLGVLLSFYGAIALITFLTFSFAALFGLVKTGLGIVQAGLGAGIIFLIQLLCLQAVRFGETFHSDIFAGAFLFTPFSVLRQLGQPPFIDRNTAIEPLFSWFGIPLVPLVLLALLLVNSVVLGQWGWKALERRFFMPNSTVISKAQSYGLTLFVNLYLIGFSWRSPNAESKAFGEWGSDHLMVFAIAQLILWVLLLIALSPQQQSLQDWARYRHRMPALASSQASITGTSTKTAKNASSVRPLSLWADLVWGEKSPVLVAIAINLLISLGFTLVWLLHHLWAVPGLSVAAWLGSTLLVFTSAIMVMLIGSTLVQFVFLYRQQYAIVVALGILVVMLAGLPITLALTSVHPSNHPYLWLTLFPWGTMHTFIPGVVPSTATLLKDGMGLVAQVSCLGLLNYFLVKQFQSIGESDIKALLSDSNTAIS